MWYTIYKWYECVSDMNVLVIYNVLVIWICLWYTMCKWYECVSDMNVLVIYNHECVSDMKMFVISNHVHVSVYMFEIKSVYVFYNDCIYLFNMWYESVSDMNELSHIDI